MSIDDVFNFVGKAFSVFMDIVEKNREEFDRREDTRVANLDDEELRRENKHFQQYEGNEYLVNSRKEHLSKEMQKRNLK